MTVGAVGPKYVKISGSWYYRACALALNPAPARCPTARTDVRHVVAVLSHIEPVLDQLVAQELLDVRGL